MPEALTATVDGEALFGRVFHGADGWVIDGKPFVMARVRAMFPGAKPIYNGGKFSHCMIELPKTPSMAKDILWLLQRFPLELEGDLPKALQWGSERYDRQVLASAVGDKNHAFDLSPLALQMAEPPRPHQIGFRNLGRGVGRLLLGDELGLGKTISAISTLCEPDARPALIVVPTHLMRQWAAQIRRFLPDASVHLVKSRKAYKLPEADVIITGYTRLQGWQDTLVPLAPRTVIFDEVQDLRHLDTTKRAVARAISQRAEYCYGLSATPIYNYGAEMWSVMDVVSPGCLGPRESFTKEWSGGGETVKNPEALRSYLVSQGLFLRRTRADLGIVADPVTRDVVTLEGDLDSLAEVRDVARTLAMSVLSNTVGESDKSARELDWKLRQATGIAKAKATAEFVKMLVDSGEKVLLIGWHRAVRAGAGAVGVGTDLPPLMIDIGGSKRPCTSCSIASPLRRQPRLWQL
ncbi:MAG: SNF2-related protein [Fimbriimonas sp.]